MEIPSSKLTQIGDYDFILYANDTPDSNGTSRTANSTNWFEIYQPIQLYITANYPIDFTFYRPGTKWIVHRFVNSSGYYNFTLHKRNYDFVAKINDDLSGQHTIKFTNMNSTATSELEFGEVSNITNPLNISIIPLYLVNPPIPWRHELSALYISQKMSYSNITISLNYSKKIGEIDYEPAIKMYKCSVWVNDSCNSGWLPVNVVLNTSTHTISTVQTNTSVYYAFEAEICGNGICGSGESCYNCPEDCGKCGGGTTGTSGTAGGTTGGITPVCGNDICEAGENEVNCPEDCAKEFFTLKTNLTEAYLQVSDSAYYALWITNLVNKNLNVSISLSQPLQKFISVKNKTFVLEAQKEKVVTLLVSIPNDTEPGTYSGEIVVTGDGRTGRLPIVLTITSKSVALDVDVEAITKTVAPNETAKFKITLYDTGEEKRLDVNLTILVSSIETNKTIYKKSFIKSIEATQYFTEYIPIPENITTGSYQITVKAKYDGKESKAMDTFDVTTTFWTSERIREVIILILAASIILSLIYGRKRYILWKLRKARYIFPVDMRTLPTGELWIGKIAETETKATFVMDDLTTHILVAGATGAGKSVTANIFVEELLEKKIPVIVFDPTGQWTGFVKPCRDKKVLKYYRRFGLSKEDAKYYPGMIYEITDPNVKIDFKKYVNPGEITVFVMNKLKPGEYDTAVINIIDTIFSQPWEESTHLKLVVAFDEVHRLLEKYGGKGGYIALERACREFRKWGIGLIMVSQVLSDFKEAIKGNVLTEVQMHTKSLADLSRIEKKYGLEYAKRVAREEVGIGMMQNPKYNKGRPWFIAFRPPLHMPHKIPDEEMRRYKEYTEIIGKIELRIVELENKGKDMTDSKIELKLAKTKLKQGRFRMAEIYITSLRKRLGV